MTKLLVRMYGGSHMFGLNTPNSDTDYLNVYLPDIKDLVLMNYSNSYKTSTSSDNRKNTKNDVDETYYSLHYFIKLLEKGQTGALEMISVKKENLIEYSKEWEFLMANKHRFYTKNMSAFMGYCKSQAQIYSRKGDRINILRKLIEKLTEFSGENSTKTVGDFINQFSEYVNNLADTYGKESLYCDKDKNGIGLLCVCGKKFQYTLLVKKFINDLKEQINSFGERALSASKNCIDFKAVSHAFRVIQECEDIVDKGEIILPLENKEFIMSVKLGKIDAVTCFDMLEERISIVSEKIQKSNLPEKPDMSGIDNWLLSLYNL